MLSGINIEATVKLAQALTIPVIASGGLGGMCDIEQLCAVEKEGVQGVICGRAIYSGDLDFAAAQARADARGKASAPVLKSERQRALLVALTAGAGLAEHSSPPAASLHVLSGRFRLYAGDVEWICGPGQLVAIPPERHAVDCLEDGVFLLTVTPPARS